MRMVPGHQHARHADQDGRSLRRGPWAAAPTTGRNRSPSAACFGFACTADRVARQFDAGAHAELGDHIPAMALCRRAEGLSQRSISSKRGPRHELDHVERDSGLRAGQAQGCAARACVAGDVDHRVLRKMRSATSSSGEIASPPRRLAVERGFIPPPPLPRSSDRQRWERGNESEVGACPRTQARREAPPLPPEKGREAASLERSETGRADH